MSDNTKPFCPLASETLVFDGKGQYRAIDNSAAFNFARTRDFTVSVRVRPAKVQPSTTNEDVDIVEKWSQKGGYPFVIRYITRGANQGRILAARYDGSKNPVLLSKSRVDDGKFHHIAFVRRTVSKKGVLSLYVDGKLEDSKPDITTSSTQNDSPLYLGCRGLGKAGMNYYAGHIRDLEIYGFGMTEEELTAAYPKAKQPPNILIILADDLGVDAMQVNPETGEVVVEIGEGRHKVGPVPLPNLQKMLRHGTYFTHAWAHPQCAPSRASLFTGLHPWRNGVGSADTNYTLPEKRLDSDAPIVSLAEMLSTANYRTAMFGKWHLGEPAPGAKRSPIDWGFSRFEGTLGPGLGGVMSAMYGLPEDWRHTELRLDYLNNTRVDEGLDPATYIKKREVAKQVVTPYLRSVCPNYVEQNPDLSFYLWEKDMEDRDLGVRKYEQPVDKRTHLYATLDQLHAAKNFIKQQAGAPWSIAWTLNVPHDPYHVPPQESFTLEFKNPAKPTIQEMFVAMMQSLDFYVGQLLNSEEPEIREQIANTVIFFMGDNGTQGDDKTQRRQGVEFGELLDDDLRDKGTHYAGGSHVPLIVTDGGSLVGGAPCYFRAPDGGSPVNRHCDDIVHIIDVFQTCADITGAAAPGDLDSVSLAPHIRATGGSKRKFNFSQLYAAEKAEAAARFASICDGTYKLSCVRAKAGATRDQDVYSYEFFMLSRHKTVPSVLDETQIKNFHTDEEMLARAKVLHQALRGHYLDGGWAPTNRALLKFPDLPQGPPKIDIYFVSDITNSMADTLKYARQEIRKLHDHFAGEHGIDLAWGIASFGSLADENQGFQAHSKPTSNFDDVQRILDAWEPGGAQDAPEAQLFALHQLAEKLGGKRMGWRPGAERIVVWLGDSDVDGNVLIPIPGTDGDHLEVSEELVIARLQLAEVSVVAIDHGGGLNRAGRAGRIAEVTGGRYAACDSPDKLLQTLHEALLPLMPVKRPAAQPART